MNEARDMILKSRGPLFCCVLNLDGTIENTWIVKSGNRWCRVPRDPQVESHLIRSASNREQSANARVLFRKKNSKSLMDPSDVKGDEEIEAFDCFKMKDDGGRWVDIEKSLIGEVEPYSPLQAWQIEFPSMVFCFISEADTALYNLLKTVCDVRIGISSQVIVQAKAMRMRPQL